jgi:hypothetical protein
MLAERIAKSIPKDQQLFAERIIATDPPIHRCWWSYRYALDMLSPAVRFFKELKQQGVSSTNVLTL